MSAKATILDGVNLRRALARTENERVASQVTNGSYFGNLHLAVMTGPYLDMIRLGRKTVESRFHRQRRTPLFTAERGDIVIFQQSGQPAETAAILGNIYYLDIHAIGIAHIRAEWADRIGCNDDEFWNARADARWVSLLTIDAIFSIQPQLLHKRDRSAWVTYPPEQGTLWQYEQHE